jgi:hypothetical protein
MAEYFRHLFKRRRRMRRRLDAGGGSSLTYLKIIQLGENKMEPETLRTTTSYRRVAASALTFAILLEQTVPTLAFIENTATASGTYNSGTTTSPGSLVTVPVTSATPTLTTVKSVTAGPTSTAGTDNTITDGGDTITFQYVVTNTGNVTITGVTPVEAAAPTFNSTAGTGSYGSFSPAPVTLTPGSSQTFTAVYTMSTLDVLRGAGITAGVSNVANATGTPATGTLTAPNSTPATTTIPAGPKLQVVKSVVNGPGPGPTGGATGGTADVNEVIRYRYRVTNIGNVAMTNVTINDVHEAVALAAGTVADEVFVSNGPLGASPATNDVTPNNGTWSVIQPGATVDFFYIHTVTQAEFDAG